MFAKTGPAENPWQVETKRTTFGTIKNFVSGILLATLTVQKARESDPFGMITALTNVFSSGKPEDLVNNPLKTYSAVLAENRAASMKYMTYSSMFGFSKQFFSALISKKFPDGSDMAYYFSWLYTIITYGLFPVQSVASLFGEYSASKIASGATLVFTNFRALSATSEGLFNATTSFLHTVFTGWTAAQYINRFLGVGLVIMRSTKLVFVHALSYFYIIAIRAFGHRYPITMHMSIDKYKMALGYIQLRVQETQLMLRHNIAKLVVRKNGNDAVREREMASINPLLVLDDTNDYFVKDKKVGHLFGSLYQSILQLRRDLFAIEGYISLHKSDLELYDSNEAGKLGITNNDMVKLYRGTSGLVAGSLGLIKDITMIDEEFIVLLAFACETYAEDKMSFDNLDPTVLEKVDTPDLLHKKFYNTAAVESFSLDTLNEWTHRSLRIPKEALRKKTNGSWNPIFDAEFLKRVNLDICRHFGSTWALTNDPHVEVDELDPIGGH